MQLLERGLEAARSAVLETARSMVVGSALMTSATCVKRSTPAQSASVTTPTGRPSSTTTAAPCERLPMSVSAVWTVSCGQTTTALSMTVCLGLDRRDHVRHHVGGDVLGDDGDAAAAGDGLGHPAAGDGRHVGDDERDRGAGAVGGREVDVEREATSERDGTRKTSPYVRSEVAGWPGRKRMSVPLSGRL